MFSVGAATAMAAKKRAGRTEKRMLSVGFGNEGRLRLGNERLEDGIELFEFSGFRKRASLNTGDHSSIYVFSQGESTLPTIHHDAQRSTSSYTSRSDTRA
jgi:hypothetical protein